TPAAGTPAPLAEEVVHTAIAAVARANPEDTAVVCGGDSWTYARLERRAEAVALRLRELGAGPETAVAVMLGRTPDLIAACLGTWKAGAAYVPLDPAAPDERLAHILEDSGAVVLVSDLAGATRLRGRHHGPWLALDTDERLAATDRAPEAAAPADGLDGRTPTGPGTGPRRATGAAAGTGTRATAPPEAPADPARLAYLMYTSGSTGRPKGVAVEHRSLLAMLRASQAHLDFGQGPDDAWLALAQPTFDISWTELLMPLTAGGRVVLARERDLTDHAAQLRLIEEHGVSHLQAAPPHWQMLIDAGLGRRPLVGQTGGEPCPP
ncbi:AMP-binding protein, partial [Streptomyces sp. BR123]|uniref:AMP-binding protein n=1 Tax=Streptomyces sp. BR123 TaxID=2749828 RepID=UPI0015C4E62B